MEEIEAQDVQLGASPWDINGDEYNRPDLYPSTVTALVVDIDCWVWLTVTSESGTKYTYRLGRHELVTIL